MSAPAARTVSGASPFTVPCVPTGMNAGVATVPCGVISSPQRAAPSVASRRNKNVVIGLGGKGRSNVLYVVYWGRPADQPKRCGARPVGKEADHAFAFD